MKSLVIHIGTHKTGSTALQQALLTEQKALQAQGFLYPDSGRPSTGPVWGHHLLPWAIQGKRGVQDERALAELKNEIEASDAHTAIVSSEEFESLSKDEVRRVAGYFREWDLHVVVYLRNPYDFMVSYYKQIVKSGACRESFAKFLRTAAGRCNYHRTCDAWSAGIGDGRLDIRMYDRIRETPGVISDFSTLFLSHGAALKIAPVEHRRNVAPADRVISFIGALNRLEGRLDTAHKHQKTFATLRMKALRSQRTGRALVALSRPFVRTSFSDDEDRSWLRTQWEGCRARLAADYLSDSDMRYLTF